MSSTQENITFWALGDLHLSLGMAPEKQKNMDIFGDFWSQHAAKIAHAWCSRVKEQDVVLLAGDLFWANRLEEAQFAIDWLGCLPGRKVMIRGNHDNWWQSIGKLRGTLPDNMYAIQNDCLIINGVAIAGARGWSYCDPEGRAHQEKMLRRETGRLRESLSHIPEEVDYRIALMHYPPFPEDADTSEMVELLEKHRINVCVYGHLHGEEAAKHTNFVKNSINYYLVSADYVDFSPIEVYNCKYKRDKVRNY